MESSAQKSERRWLSTQEIRPEGDEGTCLRPLGLCELGGSCDACWYRPDHPRFQNKSKTRKNPCDPA